MDKEKHENVVELIREKEKEGKIVLMTFDGLVSGDLKGMIYNQPVEGLLYDLNRDRVTVLSWIKDGNEKFINDYAVNLVIRELLQKVKSLQAQLEWVSELETSAEAMFGVINQDNCWYCDRPYAGGHEDDCAWMNLLNVLRNKPTAPNKEAENG